jgi:hypothetical protein
MTFAAWSMLNFNMFPFQGRGCARRASRGAAEVHLFQWNLRSLKLSSMNRNTCYAINQWNGGFGTVIHWEPHFLEGKNWMFWSMERVSWIDPTRGTWCLEYPMRQINSKSVGINGDPRKDSHCLIWLATRSRILMTWPDSDGVHWQTWTLGNNMFVALPCFAISSLLTQWFSICLGIEDHWNNFIIVYHEYAPDNSPDTNHYPIGAHQLLKFAREPEDSEPSSERMPLGRRAKAFQVTQKNVRNTLSWW